MNLKETIELIQNTAKEAVQTKIVAMPNNPQKHLIVCGQNATPIDTPFTDEPRRHSVESIESFAAAYDRWGQAGGEELTAANIWIDLANWHLTFFTDEPLRRSWINLILKPSPQLQLMERFGDAVAIDQKALVRMLRHDLADCVDAGVLAAFRSVDFQKISTARAAIQHEKQSLDSDIVAQVMGEKKPDSFLVDLPLFAMKEMEDSRTRIGITIDIDCDNRKFVLQAKPGHLEMAMDDAQAAVLTKLENDLAALKHSDVVILAGTPNAE
jgi:hypothetical protein